jgi:hypothetical protein
MVFIIFELALVPGTVGVLHRALSTHPVKLPLTHEDGSRGELVSTLAMHLVFFPFSFILFSLHSFCWSQSHFTMAMLQLTAV